jgi:hypothetical protein
MMPTEDQVPVQPLEPGNQPDEDELPPNRSAGTADPWHALDDFEED